MLNKLLKYDLKYMLKNMIVFYILSIFFSITTRLLFNMNQSVIIGIIGQISVGCMFAMIVNTLINTVMRSWVRFRDSLYKDESYLTHTLPVSKKDLYNSKFIQTLIFSFVGFLVVIVSLLIAYYSKENWNSLTNLIGKITTGLNMSTTFFVIMIVIILFLEIFNGVQSGFYGIILGYKMNNNKLVYSVIFGLITYILSQAAVLFMAFVYGLFNSSIMDLFKTASVNIDVDAFRLLALFACLIYSFIIFVMSILCKRELNKGVNVE